MSIFEERRQHVQQLVIKQYRALDAENATSWASYFSDDATFTSPYGEWNGRGAIQEFMEEHILSGMESSVRHYISNFCFMEEGENIRASFYIKKVKVNIKEPFIIATAEGNCLAEKIAQDWMVKRYDLTIDAVD
ncbi:MAG: nuclear transport factor 2 family protein [Halioglobus sp.]